MYLVTLKLEEGPVAILTRIDIEPCKARFCSTDPYGTCWSWDQEFVFDQVLTYEELGAISIAWYLDLLSEQGFAGTMTVAHAAIGLENLSLYLELHSNGSKSNANLHPPSCQLQ